MNTKKMKQAMVNIVFITLFLIALILPAFLIITTWHIGGIVTLLFLVGYWMLFDMIRELNYK